MKITTFRTRHKDSMQKATKSHSTTALNFLYDSHLDLQWSEWPWTDTQSQRFNVMHFIVLITLVMSYMLQDQKIPNIEKSNYFYRSQWWQLTKNNDYLPELCLARMLFLRYYHLVFLKLTAYIRTMLQSNSTRMTSQHSSVTSYGQTNSVFYFFLLFLLCTMCTIS